MTTGAPKNHAELKAMATSMRRRLATMFALAPNNDPWTAGQEYRSNPEHWVADIFERFAIRARIHVRAIFYRLISQKTPVIQADGTPFINTVGCWEVLNDAIRDARYLGLISADAIH